MTDEHHRSPAAGEPDAGPSGAPVGTDRPQTGPSDVAPPGPVPPEPAPPEPAPPEPAPPEAAPPGPVAPGPAGPGAPPGYAPPVPGPRHPHPPAAHGQDGPGGPPRDLFGLRPDPPAPRTGWGIRAFLIAEAVFLGVSMLVGALVGIPESGAGGILAAIVVPTVLAALVAVLLTVWTGNGPRTDLGLRFTWEDVAVGLITGLAGLVLTIPAALVYAWFVGPDALETSSINLLFRDLRTSVPVALLVMVAVVIVAPICEEILYRGLLWRAVAKHVSNRWLVFVITTVVFAFAHFELTRTPLLVVVALPVGLARVLTGRLTASVIAHQINNFLPGLALALMLTGVVPAPA